MIIMVKYHLVAQEKLSEDCAVSFALFTSVTCHHFVMGPGVIVNTDLHLQKGHV